MSIVSVDFAALDERIRQGVAEELRRPECVTQRSVESIVGIPGPTYVRLARARAFPSKKVARFIAAKTSDVLACVAPRPGPRQTSGSEARLLARVGARRVA